MQLHRVEDGTSGAWEVREHGQVMATASARPGSGSDARHLRLEVAEQHRGRGIGSWLLGTIADELSAAGCQVLETVVVRGSEAARFAQRQGAVVADHLVDDVLELSKVDRERLRRLTHTLPAGYRLVRWQESAPPAVLDSYAAVRNAIRDAPNRFPPPTPEWTPAEVRRAEQRHTERGEEPWVTAAVCDGRVVAFTEAVTTDAPQAEQHDTVVAAPHRRMGLARSVKAALVLWLCEQRPDLRTLAATYALSNTGMQAVNRQLGFREHRRRDLVRLPL